MLPVNWLFVKRHIKNEYQQRLFRNYFKCELVLKKQFLSSLFILFL